MKCGTIEFRQCLEDVEPIPYLDIFWSKTHTLRTV